MSVCSAAVLPIFGQLANLFGRRYLTLFVLCLYTLGSGMCGGASNVVCLWDPGEPDSYSMRQPD